MPKTIEVDVSRRMPVPAEAVWALLEDLTPDGVTVRARWTGTPKASWEARERHDAKADHTKLGCLARGLERLAQAGGDARG
jgi:hypothetical protein